ncbi:MarR family transcriptional regulator, partial [Myxococcota bacterium]|nr:MarR family transcriptional regulator [Myxococcota bacterium]
MPGTMSDVDEIDVKANAVLEALLSNPHGLSKYDLGRRSKLSDLEVGRACRTLQQRGLVTRARGRWKPTALAQ